MPRTHPFIKKIAFTPTEASAPRFSRATVLDLLERHEASLIKQWGFDPRCGSAQVRAEDKQRAIAYGRLEMVQDLIEELQ
jgi:hypothetical protein